MAVGEWRLQYPGVDLSLDRDDIYLEKHPEVNAADSFVDDTDVARGDGRVFGEDFLGGCSIVLPLMLAGDSASDVDLAGDVLRRAWRADAVRRVSGAVASLRSPRGRSALGRPRRYLQDDERAKYGRSRVTATFDTVDDLWYGDADAAVIPFAPLPSGGLVGPLKAPLTTSRSSVREARLEVAGDMPAPVVFDIEGPITNPWLRFGGLYFAFATSLAYDQTLTFDASPWVREITRNGAAVPGTLTADSTSLTRARIAPGTYEVAFGGISSTATARAIIRPRPAFASY